MIAINYQGVALVHSYNSHKPVLLYWFNKNLSTSSPYEFSHILSRGGEIVESKSDLHNRVESLLNDPVYYSKLLDKSKTFQSDFTNDIPFPSFSDTVQNIVTEW